jgi:hypothetical protein
MFLDKRDKNGQLLSFEAFSLSEEIAEIGVQEFTKSLVYKELKNIFPENLTILLFKKLIYEKVFKTSSKVVISNFNNKKIINTDLYSINLFKKKKDLSNFTFTENKENIFSLTNLNKKIRDYLWINYTKICYIRNLINFFFPFYENTKNKNIKIAVNFLDGLDLKERSDFFWYNKDILSNKVLTYFENNSRITNKYYRNDKKKIKSKLKSLNIEFKYLYSLGCFLKNHELDQLREKIINLKVSEEEIFLKYNALIFISKIQFTLNFFKINNIKIHQNTEEMGTGNILRQIAIKLNGGCSFGRTKSYPTNIKGDFIGFAPNDIFFSWGKETAKRIAKTENCINHIVITGDPYPSISPEKNLMILEKIEKLKKTGINFFILVLDSSYSDNKGLTWQITYTKKMEIFLEKILDFQKNNPEVGLIIKSKKKDSLKKLTKIFDRIKKLEIENKCIFVNNNNDLASHYSKFADFTLSLSAHIQGALFQCLINSKKFKGILYDDSNLSIVEKEIYKSGENKVIFNDIDKMIDEVKKYKNGSNYDPDLGKWNPEPHDPFCDGLGGKRIGLFLNSLIDCYEKGLNTEEAINKTIKEYVKVYNSDKIYEK